ncbi:MAG: hypothetical protein H0U71_06220 [Gammaproteobacteria bacterium]|nr:hypothetical protein [Gammaproteobacteria bacterium]
MTFPHAICLLITLAVLITGTIVFFYDEKDYSRMDAACNEFLYGKNELPLLKCIASTNRYVAKRGFFSMPGAFGSGAFLKYVDTVFLNFMLKKRLYASIR